MALVAAAPLIVIPGVVDGYTLPKAAVSCLGAALVLAGRRATGLSRALCVALVVLAGSLAVSAAASTAPAAAWWGRYPRHEGVLMAVVYGSALVAGARLVGSGPAARRWLLRAWAVAAVVGGASALIGEAVVGGGYRNGGWLGNASDLGAWSAVLVVVLVGAACLEPDWWLWVGAGSAAAALAVSGSRGALAGAVVGLAIVLGVAARGRMRAVAAVALVAVVALAWAVPSTRDRVTGQDPVASSTVTGRELLWGQALDVWREHPLLGVGPSGFVDAAGRAETPQWAAVVGPSFPPDSPHSWPLQVLLAGGLLLAGATGLVAVLAVRDSSRRGRRGDRAVVVWASGVVTYLVVIAVHFTSPATTPTVAVLAGLAVAVPLSGGERQGGASWAVRGGPAIVAATTAAILLLAALAEKPFAQGLQALMAGDGATADSSFEAARALRPWDIDLQLRRVRAESVAAEQGLVPPAEPSARAARVVASLPGSREAATAYASLLERAGRLDEAAAELARARTQAPWDVDLMLRTAVVAAERGRLEEAEATLREVLALRPEERAAWVNLSEVLRLQGRIGEATAAAARATPD